MMQDLTYERALVSVNCAAVMEYAFKVTRDYVRERKLFGKALLEQQNTRFQLAEVKTIATLARVFADFTVERMLERHARYLARLDGQMVGQRAAMRGGGPLPATVRRPRLHA